MTAETTFEEMVGRAQEIEFRDPEYSQIFSQIWGGVRSLFCLHTLKDFSRLNGQDDIESLAMGFVDRGIRRYRPELDVRFSTWICNFVRWRMLDVFKKIERSQKGLTFHPLFEEELERSFGERDSDVLDAVFLQEVMDLAIKDLRKTGREKVAASLEIWDGSYAEVGRTLGISRQLAKQWVDQGLEKIRSLQGREEHLLGLAFSGN